MYLAHKKDERDSDIDNSKRRSKTADLTKSVRRSIYRLQAATDLCESVGLTCVEILARVTSLSHGKWRHRAAAPAAAANAV